MDTIDTYVARFKELYSSFMAECNRPPQIWNSQENGEMNAFYEDTFLSLIIRLIAKDGKITEKEIDYMSRCLFEYRFNYYDGVGKNTVYETLELGGASLLTDDFIQWLKDGADLLTNEEMKRDYWELVRLICAIIIHSDGEVTKEEIDEAKLIMNSLQ